MATPEAVPFGFDCEAYGLTEANTVLTPADLNVKLEKDDGVSKK